METQGLPDADEFQTGTEEFPQACPKNTHEASLIKAPQTSSDENSRPKPRPCPRLRTKTNGSDNSCSKRARESTPYPDQEW